MRAQDEKMVVDQVFIPKVTVTRPNLIQFFLKELMISETKVEKIDILDISRNGFGKKNLILTYPSGELYFIFPSDTVQKIMNEWEFQANYQIVTETNAEATAQKLTYLNRPEGRIFTSLLKSVGQNYKGSDLKLSFQQTSSDVVFEVWGYDESKLILESITTEDSDFDILYVYKTVVDTVIIKVQNQQIKD